METKVAQTERRIATMERVAERLRAELKEKEALRPKQDGEDEIALHAPLTKPRGIRSRPSARN